MKKIYTILSAMLCLSIGAKAQRQLDIATTLIAPANGTTIASQQPFNFSFSIKNVGTQNVKVTDTIVYAITLGGQAITTNGLVLNQPLAANATVTTPVSNASFMFPATANGNQQFCVVALIVNRSADSSKDINMSNNAGCSQVTLINGSAAGVQNITYSVVTNSVKEIYPNPVSDMANLSISLVVKSEVSVRVLDLSGRVVLTQNEGSLSQGDHIVKLNTSALQNGMYLYQVVMGENVSSGKLFISK